MWKVVDGNISLESTYVKEECVVTEPTVCACAGLSSGIKEENEQDAELMEPSDPYLCPYMEVTVKIEQGGEACNEEQLYCNTEMKSRNLTEDYDLTTVGPHEEMKTSFSPKELHVFRNCFVRLEYMHVSKKPYACDVPEKKKIIPSPKRLMLCHIEEESNLQKKTIKKTIELGAKQRIKIYKTSKEQVASLSNTFKAGDQSYMCKKCLKAKCNSTNCSKKDKGVKLFECNDCRKTFKSKYSLLNHKQIHTGERPYSCPFCNKAFSRFVNLTRHERIHTGEKPYGCNICKKRFSVKTNLVTHIRIHTREKPFTCDFCSKQFAHASDLKKHERVHTGEKPFACDICRKQFARKYCLVKHLRTHTKKMNKQRKK